MASLRKSPAASTLLFFMFVAACGIASLLASNVYLLLSPLFGLGLGVWKKGGNINWVLRIALIIIGVVTVGLLGIVLMLSGVLFLFSLASWPLYQLFLVWTLFQSPASILVLALPVLLFVFGILIGVQNRIEEAVG